MEKNIKMFLTVSLVLVMSVTSALAMSATSPQLTTIFYRGKCIHKATARYNERLLKLAELIAFAGAEMGCLDPDNDQFTLLKFASSHALIYNGNPLKEVPLDVEINEFKPNVLVVVDECQLCGFNVSVIDGDSKNETLFFVVRRGAPFEEFYATVEAAALNRFEGIGIMIVSGEHEIKSSSEFGVNLRGKLMGIGTGEEVKIVIKK